MSNFFVLSFEEYSDIEDIKKVGSIVTAHNNINVLHISTETISFKKQKKFYTAKTLLNYIERIKTKGLI
ncbi:MAG: hypothetical protein PHE89_02800 [Alphaproteobacteria bacterium]|nr:hypothetical protein [Alphaproteobacteria bacterium]